MAERGAAIGEARIFIRKAGSLGASRAMVQGCERKIETIMLSGGIRQKGPTKAKPLDTAPKPPNLAKTPSTGAPAA